LARKVGNFQEAIERHAADLELCRQMRDPAMESVAWNQLGRVFHEMRQWEEAERHYREAARIKEENGMIGGANGAVTVWNNLALVSASAGKISAAESWYQKAIEACRKFDTPAELSVMLVNLASLLSEQPGRLEEARELAEEALTIKQALDPRTTEIWKTHTILANIADRASRLTAAREYRRLAREAKRSFAGTRYELRQHAELLTAVTAACFGQEEALPLVAAYQRAMRAGGEGSRRAADAIDRLLAGEHDADALYEGLGPDSALIIETILRALEDPSTLDDLLGNSEPE
jgi:tetratricopeptide (TPR) repeat protein